MYTWVVASKPEWLCVHFVGSVCTLLVVHTPGWLCVHKCSSSMKNDDILTWCTQVGVIENSEVKCIPCINI